MYTIRVYLTTGGPVRTPPSPSAGPGPAPYPRPP